jgi:hypothetical protein
VCAGATQALERGKVGPLKGGAVHRSGIKYPDALDAEVKERTPESTGQCAGRWTREATTNMTNGRGSGPTGRGFGRAVGYHEPAQGACE